MIHLFTFFCPTFSVQTKSDTDRSFCSISAGTLKQHKLGSLLLATHFLIHNSSVYFTLLFQLQRLQNRYKNWVGNNLDVVIVNLSRLSYNRPECTAGDQNVLIQFAITGTTPYPLQSHYQSHFSKVHINLHKIMEILWDQMSIFTILIIYMRYDVTVTRQKVCLFTY
jgi:hypothetical protein